MYLQVNVQCEGIGIDVSLDVGVFASEGVHARVGAGDNVSLCPTVFADRSAAVIVEGVGTV